MTPEQLAEIHAACFTQPRPWTAKEFADLLSTQRTRLLTTQNGFAIVQIAGPEAELLTIAVHPSARRLGEGNTLMVAALEAAKSSVCEEIFLEVATDNSPAIALNRAAGFTESALRKDYYNGANGSKVSALIMHKPL